MLQRARSAYRNWWLDAIIIIPLFPNFLSLSLSLSLCLFLSLFIFLIFLSLFVVVVCVSSPTTAEIASSLSCFPVSLCSSFYSSSFVWREAETVDLIRFPPVIQSCRKVRAVYTVRRRRTACFSFSRQCILNKDMNDGGRKSSKIREQKKKFWQPRGLRSQHGTFPALTGTLKYIPQRQMEKEREREIEKHTNFIHSFESSILERCWSRDSVA